MAINNVRNSTFTYSANDRNMMQMTCTRLSEALNSMLIMLYKASLTNCTDKLKILAMNEKVRILLCH